MSETPRANQRQVITFLFENSIFLISGAAIALFYANLAPDSYHQLIHQENAEVLGHRVNLFHFLVNDVAMAFFFLLAGKEIREAMLPGGALSSAKTATLPLLATLGGMLGPALIYISGAHFLAPELTRGWAIPMATDIAFSYMVARLIFPRLEGKTHPAIVFLLLLAIADDAGGLIVLAAFYPTGHTSMAYLLGLSAGGIALALVLWKRLEVTNFWPYLILCGSVLWYGFFKGGIHPALALVPLAWCMPHEQADLGLWEVDEGNDTLNRMEHWWKPPVEIILGLFGFVNAGVVFSAVGTGTALVFVALMCGKPLGIVLMTRLGQLFGLTLPAGMSGRDVVIVGIAAGIGFTVALFVSVVAFPAGELQDSLKMGALASFLVAPIALIAARLLRPKDARAA